MPSNKKNPKPSPTQEIQILHVKNNRKSILIEFNKGGDDHAVTYHDNPLPSFYKALGELTEPICQICELPAGDVKKIVPTGITIRPKGDNDLALIIAKKTIKKGRRVFNIISPILPMYGSEEDKTLDHMESDQARAIEKFIAEAKKYVLGDRAQGTLKLDESIDSDGGKESDPAVAPLPGMTEPEESKS